MTQPIPNPWKRLGPLLSLEAHVVRSIQRAAWKSTTFARSTLALTVTLGLFCLAHPAFADGEPAQSFVKQLRNAGYFDTAITYLGRVDSMAGVDADFLSAIELEKAQTYIDSAIAARKSEDRDQSFSDAEDALKRFLQNAAHPRVSEARLQLGKLQMIRASQLLASDSEGAKSERARESYLAAGKTFDAIVNDLKAKLTEMRGQKIDPNTDPEAASLRDQYRFEYLQSQLNAAEAIKLAAKTFDDPGRDAKASLEDAANRFKELNEKYASYAPGAIALMHLGQVQEMLDNDTEALDSYLNMLEQPDADQLRDAKYYSAAGFARLKTSADPPRFQDAIDRFADWERKVRPNEKNLPSVQEFRIELAKAYLAKSADEASSKSESTRAKSAGRQLLIAASKSPGPHVEQVNAMLNDLGIDLETKELPTAEPPKSFGDAMEKTREILQVLADLEKALQVLEGQGQTDELDKQRAEIEKQLYESRLIGIQIMRAGLVMIDEEVDKDQLDQGRQILTYLLFQQRSLRETIVVGSFLARKSPGTDVGLQGGLMALNSMQMLLNEIPDDENDGLIRQLETFGDFLAKNWPNNPQAAEAQGTRVTLLLRKDDYDGAKELIDGMAASPERAAFKRLLGQLLWNASITARSEEKDEAKAEALVEKARVSLAAGLDEIEGNLVESEGLQAALVLAKIYLLQENYDATLKTLNHPKYGPIQLIDTIGAPSESFAGEMYSAELKGLVGMMMGDDNPGQYLDRMTTTMEKLRASFTGQDAQAKLTGTYVRLARDLRTQLDQSPPAKKAKLIEAFSALLGRVSESTDDVATLRWVGQTLMSMGESLIPAGQMRANGQAAELIAQAAKAFQSFKSDEDDLATQYLLGRAYRLTGQYKNALDTIEKVLLKKPVMLDAQFEGAHAYESWAAELKPAFAVKAYTASLTGARPGPNKKNTIWGWAEISQKTNRNPNYRDKFFESRYHVALVLYRIGKVKKTDTEIKKAIKDIKQIATLFPDMGGKDQRAKYDQLLKQAQRDVGEKPTGLAPLPPANN